MNAELTAENRPACVPPVSAFRTGHKKNTIHEDEGCVQVLVVFLRVIPVKFCRFPAVYSEEVGSQVIGSQRIEEFFESRMEAESVDRSVSDGMTVTKKRWIGRTTLDLYGQ